MFGFLTNVPTTIWLALALSASTVFGSVQTFRLSSAKNNITILTESAVLLRAALDDRTVQLHTRDLLLYKQSQAVKSLSDASVANRTTYLARIAYAEGNAKLAEAKAQRILSRSEPGTDELVRCRSAMALIRDTIPNEGTTAP